MMFLLFNPGMFAQVAINIDGSQADPSAILDVKSTSRGALLPRMTHQQIAAIYGPANGLIVFCTDDNNYYVYLSGSTIWKQISYDLGTIAPFSCGSSITINHVAGPVAPVYKTVTYGTVTGLTGEPSKCWITRNLGAAQQATVIDDATEASSGWYWQFNHKQGYKYDGTTRTPGIQWNSNVNENTDWTENNDPCTIELGGTWRIPTMTEWNNVNTAGSWSNWNGPWNSGLKLHAAGNIYYSTGLIGDRGDYGFYWSSTPGSGATSFSIFFLSSLSTVTDFSQAFGFPLRCLRNN